ncbi:MAG TPA: UbiA family prenyltransferase [Methanotrichaceae archaeon]|nr:UbiA family prenyltransferase [Methanotrichaceae archaeon]HQF15746.1 UbiA family prenyltransferase [Methanotrichaceae archaeon]HQI90581.1 UbiA family prenyltransferase [Methanotrichaceae archaeon]
MKMVELPRPYLFVVPAAAGICGLFLSEQDPGIIATSLATFIPVLAWAGGQVFNDYFDIEVDEIKYPDFPIPSGIISKRGAFIYGLSLYSVCLILSAYVGIYCLAASVLAISFASIYGYAGKLKQKGLNRNLCFGLAVAMCILIGSTIGGKILMISLVVMLAIMLIYTSDNIIGRIPDVKLDDQMDINTLPLQIGIKQSANLALILTIAAAGITMSLWALELNIRYIPIAFIANSSLIWLAFSVSRDPEGSGTLTTILLRYMGHMLLFMSLIVGTTGW